MEEVGEQFAAMLACHAFGVELDAVDRELPVTEPLHRLVGRDGIDRQAVRQALRVTVSEW